MKNKKIISLILAIVFCFTITVLVATANTKTADIEILTDKTELQTGESATITVKVTTNFPVATMSIPVFYDSTLVTVNNAEATLDGYSVKITTLDSQSVDTSKIYNNTDVVEEKYGFVLVNYIGSAGNLVPETINDVVLTFSITAKSDVEGQALINCVSESAKTSDNVEGMLYFGATVNGRTIDAIPENVENIDLTVATQNVTITKKSAPNTLVINENAPYDPIIDTVNKGEFTGTIYGFDTLGNNDDGGVDGTIAEFLSTAYGDEYLEVVVGDSGAETTGAIINVLDAEGAVVETYVYVYFGDVDMDGMLTAGDSFYSEYYEANYDGIPTLEQFIACDVDGDGMITAGDAFYPEYYESNYMGMPLQSEIGAMVVNNYYEI